ncbi:MAG TPA: sulfate ABC transporter permease subunit [Actinomycetota bacterium]
MSAVAEPVGERTPRLSAATRRKLVHGGFIFLVVSYVSVLILGPLIGIAWAGVKAGWSTIVNTITEPDVLHAYLLSGIITVIAVVVTGVFGVIVALVLTRDRFPGKRIMSAIVDLPLAVSPVIVGLMAVILFGRGGWFEPWFTAHGISIIFAVPSMVIVTIFICLPFVIREVAPVLQELGTSEEEAARTLGASSMQTFFRVTLKNIRWGLLYGIALSTARAIGEIGAVLIVSGQITGHTETATLIVLRFFDQYQDASGYIVALTLALVSILLLTGIEIFKRREEKELQR